MGGAVVTLEEIAAHIEIRQVLYRYCRGVDRGDEALIRSVYHPGASDDHGAWKGEGEAFAAYIVGSMDRLDSPSQHHITNVCIDLAGERAAVESYFMALHPYPANDGGEERLAFVGGRYLDRFECRGGTWRIAERRVVLDWTRSELSGEAWPAQQAFPRGGRRGDDPSAGLFS
jgi:hypothetical protein